MRCRAGLGWIRKEHSAFRTCASELPGSVSDSNPYGHELSLTRTAIGRKQKSRGWRAPKQPLYGDPSLLPVSPIWGASPTKPALLPADRPSRPPSPGNQCSSGPHQADVSFAIRQIPSKPSCAPPSCNFALWQGQGHLGPAKSTLFVNLGADSAACRGGREGGVVWSAGGAFHIGAFRRSGPCGYPGQVVATARSGVLGGGSEFAEWPSTI